MAEETGHTFRHARSREHTLESFGALKNKTHQQPVCVDVWPLRHLSLNFPCVEVLALNEMSPHTHMCSINTLSICALFYLSVTV